MAILELSEILWELTLKCNKHPSCEFCGSKDVLN